MSVTATSMNYEYHELYNPPLQIFTKRVTVASYQKSAGNEGVYEHRNINRVRHRTAEQACPNTPR